MDVNRAKEIVESERIFQVQLDGQPVWIDSIDSSTRTATVHAQHKDTEAKTVPVDQLNEVL